MAIPNGIKEVIAEAPSLDFDEVMSFLWEKGWRNLTTEDHIGIRNLLSELRDEKRRKEGKL